MWCDMVCGGALHWQRRGVIFLGEQLAERVWKHIKKELLALIFADFPCVFYWKSLQVQRWQLLFLMYVVYSSSTRRAG